MYEEKETQVQKISGHLFLPTLHIAYSELKLDNWVCVCTSVYINEKTHLRIYSLV